MTLKSDWSLPKMKHLPAAFSRPEESGGLHGLAARFARENGLKVKGEYDSSIGERESVTLVLNNGKVTLSKYNADYEGERIGAARDAPKFEEYRDRYSISGRLNGKSVHLEAYVEYSRKLGDRVVFKSSFGRNRLISSSRSTEPYRRTVFREDNRDYWFFVQGKKKRA